MQIGEFTERCAECILTPFMRERCEVIKPCPRLIQDTRFEVQDSELKTQDSTVKEIKISEIKVNGRKRKLDAQKVEELADSIKDVGLLSPVLLSVDTDGNYELIAGLHRLEACKLLGFDKVKAIVSDLQGLYKELAEIDENLIRVELHYIDRGEHLKRRDEILAELGLKAKAGGQAGNRNASKDKNEGEKISPSFLSLKNNDLNFEGYPNLPSGLFDDMQKPPLKTTAEIAKEAGISKRTAQYEKQIATNLTPEVKKKVKELDLPKTKALELARLKPEEQEEAIKEIESGQVVIQERASMSLQDIQEIAITATSKFSEFLENFSEFDANSGDVVPTGKAVSKLIKVATDIRKKLLDIHKKQQELNIKR